MPNAKVYIHELVEIIGQNRSAYMEHMTVGWGRAGREERNMACFGVWGTVGSTGPWPETVNMWELDGWQGLAANFAHELSHPDLQDPTLKEWWAKAAPLRRGGYDRLLVPAPYTPTIEEACARGLGGVVYEHEIVTLRPGTARRYLDRLETEWLPVAARLGLRLVGAWRTFYVDDSEVICIWSLPSWEAWAQACRAYEDDPEVHAWRTATRDVVVGRHTRLMVDSPHNPLRTGRQP